MIKRIEIFSIFLYIIVLLNSNLCLLNKTYMKKNLAKNFERKPIPIVLWHGVSDNCCNSLMNSIKEFLEKQIPGVYVKSLEIGNTLVDDVWNSYFMKINEQVKIACQLISSDPLLSDGYNALGISQGALLLRAVAQRCPDPKMKNFISFGGPHQGVYGIPRCTHKLNLCDYLRKIVSYIAYTEWMQNNFVVQLEYWHDPLHEEKYKRKSVFLADINNEGVKNITYKNNLSNLDNLVLVMFLNDTVVVPKESEWFGFYFPGQAKATFSLRESALYKEDWLGLKQMDSLGKLRFLYVNGDHVHIDWDWLRVNIVDPFLK